MIFLIWKKLNYPGADITHKILCDYSIIVEIIDNKGATILFKGESIVKEKTKFVGFVDSADDAKNKYPEYFL